MCSFSVYSLCPTLCDPMGYNPPGSCPRNFPVRILEQVAISFCRVSSQPRDQTHISCFGRWILYHWATWGSRYMLQDDFYSENQPLFPLVKWKSLSHVWLFATSWYSPWNSPGQNTGVGSLSFPRGSSQPRDQTHISCFGRQILYHWATGKPMSETNYFFKNCQFSSYLLWGG